MLATIFLGRQGLLDNVKHNGDELELFQKDDGHNGKFGVLEVDSAEGLEGWYECFKNGAVQ